MNLEKLTQQIKEHEGYKSKPYRCSANKLTIGYGRNIEDNGISTKEADYMLQNDILNVKLELVDNLSFFESLNDVRQNVLIEMGYQLGVPTLLKFKKTLNFIEQKMFTNASVEMLNSNWYKQTPERAKILSKQMEKGEY